jgi:DNA polymerase III epsilon subunit-like protein
MKGFLDIETGGFSITKNGICEIALIAVNHQNEIFATFHTLIKPYTREEGFEELVSYKDDAMAINGLTVEKLIEEGSDVEIAAEQLYNFIIQHDIIEIIGHNSKVFDVPRIKYLLQRFMSVDLTPLINENDTMIIAKQKLNLPSYKLEVLCAHFGILNTDSHTAKGDAKATFELYKKLIA